MFGKIMRFIHKYFVVEKVKPINIPVFEGNLLSKKTSLIVGGSGGIGFAIAKRFVSNGCNVVITGTNEQKLIDLCKKLGDNCSYLLLDLSTENNYDQKVEEVIKRLGKIDILVNSAGIHGSGKFGDITLEEWDNILNINLRGTYFMSQAVANYMIKNKIKGHILNVSSASSAKPGWTPYEISKAGVKSLTLGLADKLVKHGIIVNSIAPGPVATEMLGRADGDNLSWIGNPTGRMATADEVANLSLFMVSSMGDLVVGDTFYISGGSGTICIDR